MQSAPGTEDGSEDVNDFLQRIRELGDKRDKEDEERTRKLEEEILQGRKERQARRAGTLKCLLSARPPPDLVEGIAGGGNVLRANTAIGIQKERDLSPLRRTLLRLPAQALPGQI